MTVKVCDRCGRSLPMNGTGQGFYMIRSSLNRSCFLGSIEEGNQYENYDLCPNCYSRLRDFINNFRNE